MHFCTDVPMARVRQHAGLAARRRGEDSAGGGTDRFLPKERVLFHH